MRIISKNIFSYNKIVIMKLLEFKKDLKSSIPLIALITSINLVLIALGTYLPITIFFIALIIVFPSTLLATFIKKRYYLLYVFVVTILGFLVSIGDISFIIYYFLPSLLISFVFSLGLINKNEINNKKVLKIDKYILILLISFLNLFIEIALIYLGLYLFNFDIVKTFLTLFNLENNEYVQYFIYLIIFVYSFVSILISFFFLTYEIKRFNNEVVFYESQNNSLFFSLINIFISLLLLLSSFFFLNFSYLFLFISFIILIFLIYKEIKFEKSYLLLIISSVLILISIFTIAYLKDIEPIYQFLFLNIVPLISSLIYLLKRLIIYKFKKIK